MTCISLLTDFGLKDGNVGTMKGVIWGIAPESQISDLSHEVAPQNIKEATFVLGRAAPYFPHGTIHLVVVDPGVGTKRRPMAAELGPYRFVGPDNGVITRLVDLATHSDWSMEFVHLDKPEYWLSEVSHVFHGRDIFAPVAAHLSTGIPLRSIGTPIDDPILLSLPLPVMDEHEMHGEVIYIDHFGSLVTNIRKADIRDAQIESIKVGENDITGMVNTFGDRPPGSLVALFSSTGDLIISIVNGSAEREIRGAVGDQVIVEFHKGFP